MDYTKEAQRYRQEISSYLGKVRKGRRVAKADLTDPKFSTQAEDRRIQKSLGLYKKKVSMIDADLTTGFDLQQHHLRMLTTGPFAEARQRQSVLDASLLPQIQSQEVNTDEEDAALGIKPLGING